ncbi:MAG: hypothetical protein V4623_04785, partial [Pseudomonadota bacterium]
MQGCCLTRLWPTQPASEFAETPSLPAGSITPAGSDLSDRPGRRVAAFVFPIANPLSAGRLRTLLQAPASAARCSKHSSESLGHSALQRQIERDAERELVSKEKKARYDDLMAKSRLGVEETMRRYPEQIKTAPYALRLPTLALGVVARKNAKADGLNIKHDPDLHQFPAGLPGGIVESGLSSLRLLGSVRACRRAERTEQEFLRSRLALSTAAETLKNSTKSASGSKPRGLSDGEQARAVQQSDTQNLREAEKSFAEKQRAHLAARRRKANLHSVQAELPERINDFVRYTPISWSARVLSKFAQLAQSAPAIALAAGVFSIISGVFMFTAGLLKVRAALQASAVTRKELNRLSRLVFKPEANSASALEDKALFDALLKHAETAHKLRLEKQKGQWRKGSVETFCGGTAVVLSILSLGFPPAFFGVLGLGLGYAAYRTGCGLYAYWQQNREQAAEKRLRAEFSALPSLAEAFGERAQLTQDERLRSNRFYAVHCLVERLGGDEVSWLDTLLAPIPELERTTLRLLARHEQPELAARLLEEMLYGQFFVAADERLMRSPSAGTSAARGVRNTARNTA